MTSRSTPTVHFTDEKMGGCIDCCPKLNVLQLAIFSCFCNFARASSSASSVVSRLSHVEASVMGESALIDKDTGRIYWEGGASSTLSASLAPKLNSQLLHGLSHLKASILTCILLAALVRSGSCWLSRQFENSAFLERFRRQLLLSTVALFVQASIRRLPKVSRWTLIATVFLYLIEAYTCSTRRYLANAISSPDELEAYIEKLRQQSPTVEWKVRSFHYDTPLWLAPLQTIHSWGRRWLARGYEDESDLTQESTPILFQRKVVTHQATGHYQYSSCIDKTVAGVWKRSIAPSTIAPFSKISLSKLLILADTQAREDYFNQQSRFVTEHGRGDEYAEFATNIHVDGYKPRMLAVRSLEGVPSARLFRLHLFWVFTLLGLTVPYRIWFSNHCDELRVIIVKETSTRNEATATSFRQWLSSMGTTEGQGDTSGHDVIFRSAMERLKLYKSHRLSASQQLDSLSAVEHVDPLKLG